MEKREKCKPIIVDGKMKIQDSNGEIWGYYGEEYLLKPNKSYFQDWFMFSNGISWIKATHRKRMLKKYNGS